MPFTRNDQFEFVERLQTLRGWAIGLGLVAGVLALIVAGFVNLANPKAWSSAFSALAASGLLRWAAVPLAIVSGVLLVAAVALQLVIERGKNAP